MKAPSREQLRHLGSLITYEVGDKEHCLGYVLCSEGRGCFDPEFGRIDITPEEAEAHNTALSTAMIQGMDNCEVGQSGTAYYQLGKGVTTWTGEVIAPEDADLFVKDRRIIFRRKGRVFKGRLASDSNHFTFTRTA